mmetsp:Transcript_38699/g.97272  ORF Transcript_38699/g.97272 Transcript_38699/m.97272 type:complete len:213 (-) Transcript_38699:427-1065(-)
MGLLKLAVWIRTSAEVLCGPGYHPIIALLDGQLHPVLGGSRSCARKSGAGGDPGLDPAHAEQSGLQEFAGGIPADVVERLCGHNHLYQCARSLPVWGGAVLSAAGEAAGCEACRASKGRGSGTKVVQRLRAGWDHLVGLAIRVFSPAGVCRFGLACRSRCQGFGGGAVHRNAAEHVSNFKHLDALQDQIRAGGQIWHERGRPDVHQVRADCL